MKPICLFIVAVAALAAPIFAQTATLRGQATGESGAAVPGARIALAGPGGLSKTTMAAGDGSYSFADLPSGSYTVQASAPLLALRRPAKISLKTGIQTLNISLNVAAVNEQVTVEERGRPAVSTEAAQNASAVAISGSDLDALSDNPDDLLVDLQALGATPCGR